MAQTVKQAFLKDIQEKLFAGAGFVKESVSHDQWVTNDVVNIPQSGALPDVVADRSTLPATIKQRTDDNKTYSLIEFSTDPIVLNDTELLRLSYNKRQSVISHHIAKMNDRIALQAMYQWASTGALLSAGGQIILTSDSTNADATANAPGATGNRNSIALADIAAAAGKLDDDDVPQDGRYMIIPAKMYWNHLLGHNQSIMSRDYNPDPEALKMGAVKKLYGINIIPRSYTTVYANAATPTLKAVGAATATTDCFGTVVYQRDQVAKALGSIKFFEQKDAPEYYGDIISAKVLFNATKLRTDAKGIATIVQDT